MARETRVQSQVESYQRPKKWYLMPPCLTLGIIRYGSRVKWCNLGKGVAPSPTPWCSKLSKREPSGHPRLWSHYYIISWSNIYIEVFIDIIIITHAHTHTYMHTHTHTYTHSHTYIYIYIYIQSSTDRLFRSIRTLQCG